MKYKEQVKQKPLHSFVDLDIDERIKCLESKEDILTPEEMREYEELITRRHI